MIKDKTNSLTKTGDLFYPEAINQIASQVDYLFYFILILSTILFIGLIIASILFILKPRKKDIKQLTHMNSLELAWTIIPTIIVMFIFVWGFKDYLRLQVPSASNIEIKVSAQKWFFVFEYPNGFKSSNDLIIPEKTNIKLIMNSKDVLHGFFIPNMRIKRDVIPNRYTVMTIQSDKTGKYQIFCTEYCGTQHSQMLANLIVKTKENYNNWLLTAGNIDKNLKPEKLGEKLYTDKGCAACHSIDGSNMIGPTWKNLYNKKREFTNSTNTIADENYLRESIVYPGKKIVKGYNNVMPSYAGLLSDDEIDAIISYIKTLK